MERGARFGRATGPPAFFTYKTAILRLFVGILGVPGETLSNATSVGRTIMKTRKLRLYLTPLLATSVSALFGSGLACAEGVEISDATSDTIEHIVAKAEAGKVDQKSVTVNFSDLNMNNEQGALVLYQRLQRASETVCAVLDAKRTKCLTMQREADECYHRTLGNAVESVGSELLMSIHHDREPGEMFAATVE
jgi:UrcA family protein